MKRFWVGVLIVAFMVALAPHLSLGAASELLPSYSLSQKNDPILEGILDSLGFDHGLRAKDGTYYSVDLGPDQPWVNVVALEQASEPDQKIYLFYQEMIGKVFFLKVGPNAYGQPEMRLWSQGGGELVFSEEGVGYEPGQSAKSFRIAEHEALGLKSVSDSVYCLAAILGISISGDASSYNSFVSLLASLYCSASNVVEVLTAFQTACNCISTLSLGAGAIFGTLGCVDGLSKLILCNIISCDGGGCASGTIALTNGEWRSDSVSQRGSNTYCLDLSSWSSVNRIVVELDVSSGDPDLYTNHDGSLPSTSDWDCRPYYGNGWDEQCSLVSPQVGPNYMLVYGFSSASYFIKATAD